MDPTKFAKELKVKEKIQETPDAVSLVLEIPKDLISQFRYQAGQFVSFFLKIGGETLSRSYSLSTSPVVDQEFKVTIKRVNGGRGSTFLCEQVKVGDTLLTTPPAGQFFKPTSEPAHFTLFAAGSGITPVFSILKTVLKTSDQNSVTLVYCNRDENSIIYKKELAALEQTYTSRLNVLHVLSRPVGPTSIPAGRVSAPLVEKIHRELAKDRRQEFYLCGPTEFMTLIQDTLMKLKVAKDQIHIEDFGVSVHQAPPSVDATWTVIGPEAPVEKPEKIIAQINGETLEIAAKEGQSVLETLLEAGAQAPYSCMDGACMACMAKIQEGRVYQTDPGILTDDNVKNCEALTCQAKPLSRIVKLSYDNL
ncbi:MAG: 2Fe-2S iron-sulfur cluster-binding protein [Bdellovibrionales bacterium]